MQFTVVYSDGVWSFKVSSLEDEPDYLEEFEITKLEEAQNIADELIAEIMEMTDDIFDDVEQMNFLTNNQKQQ